jgi:hypothetical protein
MVKHSQDVHLVSQGPGGLVQLQYQNHDLLFRWRWGRLTLLEMNPIDFTRWECDPVQSFPAWDRIELIKLVASKMGQKGSLTWVS